MKVVIPGGSGQVGTMLARALQSDGHEVIVLSRTTKKAPWAVVIWDGSSIGSWVKEIDGSDAVINLAGRSVNCRYTARNREAITQSRVRSTQIVGEAIAVAHRPPRVWLQASTATIYAHRCDTPNDEATGILGGDEPDVPETWRFSIDVASSWERELDNATVPRTRKVKLRSAMTMSPDRRGIFETYLSLVRLGLGGKAGDGRQYVSWVHETDFIRAIYWLIDHSEVDGAVNIAALNPLPNAAFMRELRNAWGISLGLPATKWMLEIGAVFMGTETELILKSRRVIPGVLTKGGFTFQFPRWAEAAEDLCRRWREQNGRTRRAA